MGSRAAAAALLLALAGGCATTSAPTPAPPAPQRPVVNLAYDLSSDLHTATGTETVRFTPDQQVCELGFRDWTDAPTSVAAGNALDVTAASVDGRPVTPRTDPAGAPPGAPGTLVTLPLPLPAFVPAGGPSPPDSSSG